MSTHCWGQVSGIAWALGQLTADSAIQIVRRELATAIACQLCQASNFLSCSTVVSRSACSTEFACVAGGLLMLDLTSFALFILTVCIIPRYQVPLCAVLPCVNLHCLLIVLSELPFIQTNHPFHQGRSVFIMYVSVAITFMTVRSLVFSHFHSALLFILLNYVSYTLFVLIDIDSIMVYTSGVHDHNPQRVS